MKHRLLDFGIAPAYRKENGKVDFYPDAKHMWEDVVNVTAAQAYKLLEDERHHNIDKRYIQMANSIQPVNLHMAYEF